MEDEKRKETGSQTGTESQNNQKSETSEKTQDDKKQDVFSREYVEELRREAGKYRTKLRELEEKLNAKEKEELEKQNKFKELYEKTLKELEELKERQQLEAFNSALFKKAQEAGFINPEDIRLADLTKVEYKEGKLLGIETVIDELKKNRPYLFKQDNVSDNSKGATGNSKGFSLKDWAKMKREDREKLLKEASKNLKI